MGSSAGGFLVLSTLFHPRNPFAAAVSIYGVADLEDLFKVTHKFEAEYTVRLVAPYPEGISIYRERSPLHNLDAIHTPVLCSYFLIVLLLPIWIYSMEE
jgi:dipeptidyl aminopeptidase/acylaminoacyl peptidase